MHELTEGADSFEFVDGHELGQWGPIGYREAGLLGPVDQAFHDLTVFQHSAAQHSVASVA
jgi:hypothetical protein